ncbi:MAG TPA: alpha/beta-hydrolase family protein [Dehalococcoidia bacterium]|nr:alpha/beta-hydrolase family protein [Dehalococcoidia bacterium]
MPAQRARWRLPRSDQAGVFAAAAGTAMTFQRTLMPRNTTDQAIVTGATMTLMYLIASLMHDAIEAVASPAIGGGRKRQADDVLLGRMVLAADLAAMGAGIAVQRSFRQRSHEQASRAAIRAGGFWLSAGAFAGLASGLTEAMVDAAHEKTGRKFYIDKVPVALLGGVTFAAVREFQRHRKESGLAQSLPQQVELSGTRALAIGTAVGTGLTGLVVGSSMLSGLLGRFLGRVLPGDDRLWRPMGHALSLGALAAVLYSRWYAITKAIEEGTGNIESAFNAPPESSLVSGSPESLVPWQTLGREGRRHISTALSRAAIENVMDEPAVDPIRVYIGLDSAPTEEERVGLALAEMERTGAFDRRVLLVTSPTGTGYVNYVAVECVEYFTRGNCATVTIQYSKRPSPLSLDRVWEGRKHFRLLLAAIHRKLYGLPPEGRPRLVVFGESLGAHTSQDAFLHTGTQGLEQAGIEHGLWVGSPHLSKWREQVMNGNRPDVDPASVGEFNSYEELESMPEEDRQKLRYFLVTHGNDGVGHFGPDLLIQQPKWLGDPQSRPPGVPPTQKWITPTTFFQTLVDMKNAMNVVPGEFDANGHDYRADLPRFVREAYRLECSDEQLNRVDQALRANELLRHQRMQQQSEMQRSAADSSATDANSDSAHPAQLPSS